MTKVEMVAEIKKLWQACWLAGLDYSETGCLTKAYFINENQTDFLEACDAVTAEAIAKDFTVIGEHGSMK